MSPGRSATYSASTSTPFSSPIDRNRSLRLMRVPQPMLNARPSAEGPASQDNRLASMQRAVQVLEEMGAQVEQVLPPRIEETKAITRQYWQRSESTSLDEWEADAKTKLSSEEVEQHLFEWDRFRRALIDFMVNYDVIVTPAANGPATPHGTTEASTPYTLPYSLTGWPCVVVRAGTDPSGLPIGVQIIASPWRDDVALAVAQVIEHALGGWQPPTLT